MPRNPRDLVDGFRPVGKLVFLAMQRDVLDEDAIATELTKVRRRAYEDEITIQLGRAGCSGRRGNLTAGPTLTEFKQQSTKDAKSIVNTYNYALAREIARIRKDNPRSNRHVYASRLRKWDVERAELKSQQIAQWTEGTARATGLREFVDNNGLEGTARLEPRTAVESVCQGWINRGDIPIKEATTNPPPYHQNCPHGWVSQLKRVPRSECNELWVGT